MHVFVLMICFTDCSLNCYRKAGGRDDLRRKRRWKSHTSESSGNSTFFLILSFDFSLLIIFISLLQSDLFGERTVNRSAATKRIFLSHHCCKSPRLSQSNPPTHFQKSVSWSDPAVTPEISLSPNTLCDQVLSIPWTSKLQVSQPVPGVRLKRREQRSPLCQC